VATAAGGSVVGEPKPQHRDLPDDQHCQHVEQIVKSLHRYTIDFRGTVDGAMTRHPIGYVASVQGWQPNRSVVIENVGPTPVVNPRLVVNGRRRWFSLPELVAEATAGCTTPVERARAIWEFRRRMRFHATTWDPESSDALKATHVYGYTLCGDEALVLDALWKAAGFRTRPGRPVGHCVTEVFYDGGFHLLDSDEHVLCLRRDNRTIASEEEIVRDHDLVKRTHTYSINQPESRQTDEFSASLYGHEGNRDGDWGATTSHRMHLTLRPGESIEFRWDHVGKQYTAGELVPPGKAIADGQGDLLAGWGPVAYAWLTNGRWRYRPDLAAASARDGAEKTDNARFDTAAAAIRAEVPGKPAAVTWRFASPYVFVGGGATAVVELGPHASAQWRYSADGRTWLPVAAQSKPGRQELACSLDRQLSPRGQPVYQFFLQLSTGGGVTISRPSFEHDIQIAPLALPELEVGTNQVEYSDAGPAGRTVRITHRWVQRKAWRPPAAPARALSPADGQAVRGSRVNFRWEPAAHPDAQPIADYHFELSDRADLRWPLSPNFERRVAMTPSAGKPEWTVPEAGLLNPNTAYYWRVRACDMRGVWGPWSKAFSFRVRAPGVPEEVRLVPAGADRLELRWKPAAGGEPPVAYRVYGSDERGFTPSDRPYLVHRGRGFVRSMEEYKRKPESAPDAGLVPTPANLVARLAGTALCVVGPEAAVPNANRAYYRVVAVDAEGNPSGPSDYAEVPRPWLVNRPAVTTAAGKPYRFQPLVIRSDGDLRCRAEGMSSYNAAFWDREELRYTAEGLPEGLRLEPASGLICGSPAQRGTFQPKLRVQATPGAAKTYAWTLSVQ
jgi:hypothetical protein